MGRDQLAKKKKVEPGKKTLAFLSLCAAGGGTRSKRKQKKTAHVSKHKNKKILGGVVVQTQKKAVQKRMPTQVSVLGRRRPAAENGAEQAALARPGARDAVDFPDADVGRGKDPVFWVWV
jgi:hypothetical protein